MHVVGRLLRQAPITFAPAANVRKLPSSPNCAWRSIRTISQTISDKVRENARVMTQIANNSREQAMLGDFQKAVEDAILDSSEAHQKQMMKLLTVPEKGSIFANIIYEMLSATRMEP